MKPTLAGETAQRLEVIGVSGEKYQIEVQGDWKNDTDFRLFGSIDKGRMHAFFRLSKEKFVASVQAGGL